MNKLMILPKFVEYLSSRGLSYTSANDDILNFSYEGLNYMFQSFQETDPYYLRIMLPKVNNKTVNTDVMRLVNQLNRDYKAVKIVEMEQGSIWMVLESFVYNIDGVDLLFARMIDVLRIVINEYRRKENEL